MKNKTTAALLSIFLGIFGVQFFYLGSFGLGMMAVIFTFSHLAKWSVIIGLIQGILLLTMTEEEFQKKYNAKWMREQQRKGYPPQQQTPQYPPQFPPTQQPNQPVQSWQTNGGMTPKQRADLENLKTEGLKKMSDYDFKGAIETLGKGLDIDPKDYMIHWHLACCYSSEENTNLALYHLENAVKDGFKNFDKIKSEDYLAFLRIQPEFEPFAKNGYKRIETHENHGLLERLKQLANLRERGLISEKEFAEQSKNLFR